MWSANDQEGRCEGFLGGDAAMATSDIVVRFFC
jgi:hypothetical protein